MDRRFATSLRVSNVNLSSNGIAQQLSPETFLRLQEICAAVELKTGQILEAADTVDGPVYLLCDAAVTLWLQPMPDTPRMALSVLGAESMVGCSHLWEQPHPEWTATVLQPGRSYQTTATQLRALLSVSPEMTQALSRFLWAQTLEIAQLSARMQLCDLRTRLALWLHLLQHKTGHLRLPITHQALADMMGVRRVSVTLTVGELQDAGILALRRGEIQLLDLPALSRTAGLGLSAPPATPQ